MSSTTIRNLINSQIDKQLYKVKGDLRNQGTKQVQKVKEKLPNKTIYDRISYYQVKI